MDKEQLTFEQVNEHFENVDLTVFQTGGTKHFTTARAKASPDGVLADVCAIYRVVRPFLSLILNVPLIPASWKNAIRTFVNLMDQLCPAQ